MSAESKSKQPHKGNTTYKVRLELMQPGAREVFVAGSFNDWHGSVTPMILLDDGRWAKELSLLPGRYEYRFLVDGQWEDDPAAHATVPNPYGGVNAVLTVSAPPSDELHSTPTKSSTPSPNYMKYVTSAVSGRRPRGRWVRDDNSAIKRLSCLGRVSSANSLATCTPWCKR